LSENRKPPAPDADLFRQALAGVTPLPPSDRIPPAKPKPAARVGGRESAAPAAADNLSDHGAGDIPLTEFARNGISRMTLRKLKRGQFPVEDSLDLHGLTTDGARQLLLAFLLDSSQRGLRCVAIIHGKGQHTESGRGVLKTLARHWLTQRAEVLAFCEAPQNLGGSGAVWVLLKAAGGDQDGA
jgi:DNA-nicking Smr family endonuclease